MRRSVYQGQENETFRLFLVSLRQNILSFSNSPRYIREKNKVTDSQAFHFCAQQTTNKNGPEVCRGMEIYVCL